MTRNISQWHQRIASLVVIGIIGVVAIALGIPNVGGEIDYFSDDTYSTQVGTIIWACYYPPYRDGYRTNYYIVADAYDCGTGEHHSYCYENAAYNPPQIECDP